MSHCRPLAREQEANPLLVVGRRVTAEVARARTELAHREAEAVRQSPPCPDAREPRGSALEVQLEPAKYRQRCGCNKRALLSLTGTGGQETVARTAYLRRSHCVVALPVLPPRGLRAYKTSAHVERAVGTAATET